MMPRPSKPMPVTPSMLMPAAPSASPTLARPPGRSSVVIVRSVAIDPPSCSWSAPAYARRRQRSSRARGGETWRPGLGLGDDLEPLDALDRAAGGLGGVTADPVRHLLARPHVLLGVPQDDGHELPALAVAQEIGAGEALDPLQRRDHLVVGHGDPVLEAACWCFDPCDSRVHRSSLPSIAPHARPALRRPPVAQMADPRRGGGTSGDRPRMINDPCHGEYQSVLFRRAPITVGGVAA